MVSSLPLAYVFVSNMADRILLCILGVAISCYSLHVEIQTERDPRYRAACDFSEHMSCSKVLTSRFSRGFGVVARLLGPDHLLNTRNCNLGIIFYLCHLTVAVVMKQDTGASLLMLMSISSIFISLYLAVILFVILRDVCVVCIATYVTNGLLLYLNYSLYYDVSVKLP